MATQRQLKNIEQKLRMFRQKAIVAQEMGFDIVPSVWTDEDIDDRLERMKRMSKIDVRRFYNAINSALNTDTGEMAIVDGQTQPMFMRVFIDKTVNMINAQREDLRAAFPMGIEDEMLIGTRMAGRNLSELRGQYYTTEDMDSLLDAAIADYNNYVNMYTAIMVENGFSEDTINQVIDIYRNDPVRFRTIMESNNDEIELNYIYLPDDRASEQFILTDSGIHRIGTSADKTSFETRYNNTERFWMLRYNEYLDGVHPFTYSTERRSN